MGNKPNPILCEDIDPGKYYIAECAAYWDYEGRTGCAGKYDRIDHAICPGYDVSDWVCNNRDCTSGYVLINFYGNAQRLLKLFGPYNTEDEAGAAMW